MRSSRLGVFNRIFAELPGKGGKSERLMIDATHLKAHQTAASPLKKGAVARRIGRTKDGLNSKLLVACNGQPPELEAVLQWIRQIEKTINHADLRVAAGASNDRCIDESDAPVITFPDQAAT